MRRSQLAVLAALGTIIVLMIGIAVWVRFVLPAPPPRPDLSGATSSRTLDLQGFDGVEVRGQWQVTITRGDSWRVEVEVPVELQDDVSIALEETRLVVANEPRPWWSELGRDEIRLTANITMPALDDIRLSGASALEFSGFDGRNLAIAASGAVQIEGSASRFDGLDLAISGAGDADLRDVSVTDANVTLSGATNVTLRMAGGALTGQMSGAGNLEYFGTVSAERIAKSGAANVRQAN